MATKQNTTKQATPEPTIADKIVDYMKQYIVFPHQEQADVLALPLAYIYDRSAIVLTSPKPDKAAFAAFLGWARSRQRDVYFLGGGGTDLLSREIAVKAIGSERFPKSRTFASRPSRIRSSSRCRRAPATRSSARTKTRATRAPIVRVS